MKKNYSFVNIILPQEQYVEKREYDGMTIVLLDATMDGDMYRCVECSVPTSEYDASEVLDAYKTWKANMEAMRLRQAKGAKIAEIEAYDTSSAINDFTLNGKHRWLPMEKRQGIAYSIEALKKEGHADVTIWFDTNSVIMPVDKALDMLNKIEVYAKETNNVTHQHKAKVEAMTSIVEVEAFDVKAGYPSKVEYSL